MRRRQSKNRSACLFTYRDTASRKGVTEKVKVFGSNEKTVFAAIRSAVQKGFDTKKDGREPVFCVLVELI